MKRRAKRQPDPLQRLMDRTAGRRVPNPSKHCPLCLRFIGHDGGCPGLTPTDPSAIPLCYVDRRTGRPYTTAMEAA